jgi:general secretion pathway protein D
VSARNVQLTWQGPAKAKPGEDIKIALRVKSDGAIRSLPLQLGYDPKTLHVTDISEGTFFSQNNGTTSFSKNIDASNGRAFVSVSRSDAAGVAGEGVALIVTARPVAPSGDIELKVLQASAFAQSDKQPETALPVPWKVFVGP